MFHFVIRKRQLAAGLPPGAKASKAIWMAAGIVPSSTSAKCWQKFYLDRMTGGKKKEKKKKVLVAFDVEFCLLPVCELFKGRKLDQ